MEDMNETHFTSHLWPVIDCILWLTQSAVLKLAHFRKTLFKCDIGLVHLTSKVISISGTVDRSPNNYNANYCKALTTVTFNRMGMVLDIQCNLESIRVSLAVAYQKHLQRKEKQKKKNPKNSFKSSVCCFISKMSN